MNETNLHVLLIEADNQRSLGGSCWRDLVNMYTNVNRWALANTVKFAQCLVLTIDSVPISRRTTFGPTTRFDKLSNYKTQFASFTAPLRPKDLVFVLVSGHGYQRSAINRQSESDGLDEYISFNSGIVLDNEFYTLLVSKLVRSGIARAVCLADTCHSGTLFDNSPNDTRVCSIGACLDHQLDACDIGTVAGFGGALTVHLLDQPGVIETLMRGTSTQLRALVTSLTVRMRPLGQSPLLIVPASAF